MGTKVSVGRGGFFGPHGVPDGIETTWNVKNGKIRACLNKCQLWCSRVL